MNQSILASDGEVDQLKALRARWRQNTNGYAGFTGMIWSAYPLHSPIGRILERQCCTDLAGIRLTDAIYDAGDPDTEEYVNGSRHAYEDYDGKERDRPLSPIAAAMAAHYTRLIQSPRDLGRRSRKVSLHSQVLDDAVAYARERVEILVEVDKALPRRVAKGLRAWRRLLGLLEAEVKELAA